MNRRLLGEVVTFVRGVTFDGAEAHATPRGGTVPILRAGNIGQQLVTDADLIWVPLERVSEEQSMCRGDIAICMSSGSRSVVGKTAILEHPFEGAVGAFCGLIRSGPLVDARYLAHWLRSDVFFRWRDSQSRGASIQNLRFSELALLEIALPSLGVQRRIAAGLDLQLASVERAGSRTSEMRAETQALRARAIEGSFERLDQPHGQALCQVGSLDDGDWILTNDYVPAGVRLFQVGDIGRGELLAKSNRFISMERATELRCTILRAGDVLISRMPDPVGRACVLPHLPYPSITAVDVTIFRPDTTRLDTDFVVQFMNSRSWLADVAGKASGATRQRISRANMELLQIPVPSLASQQRIAAELRERLATLDAMESAIRAEQEAIEALPSALLRRAFDGLIAA